ncbi:MAG TPA: ribbon-helix-helix domain-containing protein [Terracidiphilus sp.]|nr:ribbon-helix-helix domain-containing protein [Terracidiphilus sp.]
MKQKISITLSSDLVKQIDRSTGKDGSRSEFLENLVREYFKTKVREALSARDVELINRHADYLNREMEDVLRYQAPILFDTEG